MEGLPHSLAVGGTTLVASTSRQMLKLWNIARSLGGKKLIERRFEDAKTGEKYGDIASIRVNATGSKVSVLNTENRLYVYDVELDTFVELAGDGQGSVQKKVKEIEGAGTDPNATMIEDGDDEPGMLGDRAAGSGFEKADKLEKVSIASHYWDPSDARLLAIETNTASAASSSSS